MTNERREPRVTIGGIELPEADVMALRVAVESLASEMSHKGALGKDAHGEAMRLGYLAAVERLRALLVTP